MLAQGREHRGLKILGKILGILRLLMIDNRPHAAKHRDGHARNGRPPQRAAPQCRNIWCEAADTWFMIRFSNA